MERMLNLRDVTSKGYWGFGPSGRSAFPSRKEQACSSCAPCMWCSVLPQMKATGPGITDWNLGGRERDELSSS